MAVSTKDISLIQFLKRFGTQEVCEEHIKGVRWPDEITCPHCGASSPYITSRGYKCKHKSCAKKFSYKSGTLLEGAKIELPTFFLLLYLLSSNRKSISSHQIARHLSVTQKTAWHTMHKLRLVFEEKNIEKLSGTVEVDECFFGKGNLWTRWGAMCTRKTPVLGLLQRGGRVIIQTVDDRRQDTLTEMVLRYVVPGSTVYTDGWLGYNGLRNYFNHSSVNHTNKEYVRGDVHVNGIENVWSFFKKNIRNGHHWISGKHVQRYCNEVSWKFNNRHLSTMQRFDEILKRVLESRQLVIEFKKVKTLKAA